MESSERRASGVELRVVGNVLTGVVMRYGSLSLDHGERFQSFAFGVEPRAALNIQHDRSLTVLEAGDFVLSDSPRG